MTRSVSLCFGLLVAGCAAAPAHSAVRPAPLVATSVTAPAPASELAPPAPEKPAQPQQSPGYAEAMAALRPEGTAPLLQALVDAPTTPEPYARAAIGFAPSIAGMTLIWGMTYQAMGGGARDLDVATAFAQVLNERITAQRDAGGQGVSFNLRLAPGQMPMLTDPDGAVRAPVAHVFESSFGPAVTGFRPPWTIEQFYDVLSNWVGVIASHGTPLDDALELDAWLVALAKAGHLEAFCYQLLGTAFPKQAAVYKRENAGNLRAYLAYSKGARLAPKRAILPDELVRLK